MIMESPAATTTAETASVESADESTSLTTVAKTTATVGATIGAMTTQIAMATTATLATAVDTNGAHAMDLGQDHKVGYFNCGDPPYYCSLQPSAHFLLSIQACSNCPFHTLPLFFYREGRQAPMARHSRYGWNP